MKKNIETLLKSIYNTTKQPITFFDCETSGLDLSADELIQIYACNYDGQEFKEFESKFKITCECSKEAFEKHGYTKEDLMDCDNLIEHLPYLYENYFSPGITLGGFNSNSFDIPFLVEKAIQLGFNKAITITSNKTIDVMQIYRELYPNTLEGIYSRLVGHEMTNSHDAKSDIYATLSILDKIVELNPNISLNTESETLDTGGFFKRTDEGLFFAKGKYRNMNILTMNVTDAIGFLKWISNTNTISIHSRTIANKIIQKIENLQTN
jgi:DNA polymerase III alpha subunit (gram-positive type)